MRAETWLHYAFLARESTCSVAQLKTYFQTNMHWNKLKYMVVLLSYMDLLWHILSPLHNLSLRRWHTLLPQITIWRLDLISSYFNQSPNKVYLSNNITIGDTSIRDFLLGSTEGCNTNSEHNQIRLDEIKHALFSARSYDHTGHNTLIRCNLNGKK